MGWVAPGYRSDGAGAVDNHVFGPLIRVLEQTAQGLLVLDHGPVVELLRRRVAHDVVHEVLVALEGVAKTHQGEEFGAELDFDSGGEDVAVAVLLLSGHEQVAGNFVGFDPDVRRAHYFPFKDGAHGLVQVAKVPGGFDAFLGHIPKSTGPWETCSRIVSMLVLDDSRVATWVGLPGCLGSGLTPGGYFDFFDTSVRPRATNSSRDPSHISLDCRKSKSCGMSASTLGAVKPDALKAPGYSIRS